MTINAVTLTVLGYFFAEALLLGGASLASRLSGTLRLAVNGGAILSAAAVATICWLVRGTSR